jgi:hypothetical protein
MNAMILTVFLVATQMPPPPPTVPIGGVQVVVPAEPAQMVEFGVSLKEWLKFFSDRIVPTVQTGIDKYQKALKIVQFTVADMDCLTARMLQGHFANVLNSAISADYPVPMDIMDKYYQSYKNAEENARQKCGGPGNQGQRLWAVWVQEASAEAGTRTLPSPSLALGVDKAALAKELFTIMFDQRLASFRDAAHVANLPTTKAQALENFKKNSESFARNAPAFWMMYYQAKMVDVATGNPP